MTRAAILFALLGLAGCVQREISIDSQPQGALVYLNGDEAGRTPLTKEFLWYGTYDVVLRKEGYQPIRTKQPVIAPWWQWPPFDLFAELFDVKDARSFNYTMTEVGDPAIDLDATLSRASELAGKLESSRAPATQPAR